MERQWCSVISRICHTCWCPSSWCSASSWLWALAGAHCLRPGPWWSTASWVDSTARPQCLDEGPKCLLTLFDFHVFVSKVLSRHTDLSSVPPGDAERGRCSQVRCRPSCSAGRKCGSASHSPWRSGWPSSAQRASNNLSSQKKNTDCYWFLKSKCPSSLQTTVSILHPFCARINANVLLWKSKSPFKSPFSSHHQTPVDQPLHHKVCDKMLSKDTTNAWLGVLSLIAPFVTSQRTVI